MPRSFQIAAHPSPNFGPRKDGLTPSLVVLHYTAMQTAAEAIARLCDPVAEVSAHYVVSHSGQITQLVAETERAWHAGRGSWAGLDDINSRSIGIELDNRGDHPFAAAQMDALEWLLQEIMGRWDIPAAGVIGHSDLAPGRKIDPGPHFDWTRLARQGLAAQSGVDPGPEHFDMSLFRTIAAQAGYTAQAPDEAVLQAVRLRHRPLAKGSLSPADFSPLGPATLWT